VGVVLVHGKDGSKSSTWGDGFVRLALDLQAAGYQVLMLDLRGHGASGDGRYAFGFMERFDVIAGVQHLVEEAGVAPGSVGLLGVSMGGASVLYAAALDPRVGAVWSDAAYADVWPIIVQEWPDASGLPLFGAAAGAVDAALEACLDRLASAAPWRGATSTTPSWRCAAATVRSTGAARVATPGRAGRR
jgi:pimeloyl-ACP methyl ester carboxylesterase